MSDIDDTDPWDFLQDNLRHSNLYNGDDDMTPQKAAENFLRNDAVTRAKFLSDLDKRIERADLSVERAGKVSAYRKKMRDYHFGARRLGR